MLLLLTLVVLAAADMVALFFDVSLSHAQRLCISAHFAFMPQRLQCRSSKFLLPLLLLQFEAVSSCHVNSGVACACVCTIREPIRAQYLHIQHAGEEPNHTP